MSTPTFDPSGAAPHEQQATKRKRGKRGGRRRGKRATLLRKIDAESKARSQGWATGDRRQVRDATISLNGRVGARESGDLTATDAKGDDAYLGEPDRGLYAELRRDRREP